MHKLALGPPFKIEEKISCAEAWGLTVPWDTLCIDEQISRKCQVHPRKPNMDPVSGVLSAGHRKRTRPNTRSPSCSKVRQMISDGVNLGFWPFERLSLIPVVAEVIHLPCRVPVPNYDSYSVVGVSITWFNDLPRESRELPFLR
jgi:hypothetical protein